MKHGRDGDHQRLAVGLPVKLVEEQQRLLVLVVGQVVGSELEWAERSRAGRAEAATTYPDKDQRTTLKTQMALLDTNETCRLNFLNINPSRQ